MYIGRIEAAAKLMKDLPAGTPVSIILNFGDTTSYGNNCNNTANSTYTTGNVDTEELKDEIRTPMNESATQAGETLYNADKEGANEGVKEGVAQAVAHGTDEYGGLQYD